MSAWTWATVAPSSPRSALKVIQAALETAPDVIAVIMTGNPSIESSVTALQEGAWDYLPKPFAPRELLARIRAVLRRSGPTGEPPRGLSTSHEFGEFLFDDERRVLYRNDQEVELSRAEFDLLQVFVHRPNRVLSRDLIMDRLSGGDRDPFDRSIDVRVARLRHKMEDDPSDPKLIRTVWGVGYQFTPKGDSP